LTFILTEASVKIQQPKAKKVIINLILKWEKIISLFFDYSDECYNKLLSLDSIQNDEYCPLLLASKLVSIVIVLQSCLQKIPQISAIIEKKSTHCLSLGSIIIETVMYFIVVHNSYVQGSLLVFYLDNYIYIIQNTFIIYLILKYNKRIKS